MKRGRFEQQKPKKRFGIGKILLIILAVILVIVIAAAVFLLRAYDSVVDRVTKVTVPAIVMTDPTEATEVIETTAAETTEATTIPTETVHVPSSADYINILVVGQASRAGENTDTERAADSMILCTINTYEKSITLTSLLRDSLVKPPDFRGKQFGKIKLTTVYHLGSYYSDGDVGGSMQLMNQTLYDNFGIEVDHNIELSFDSVVKAIDLLGGIGVELTEAEAAYLNADDQWVCYDVEPGFFWLDGAGALSYARMRKAEGDGESDIKRTARQRNLVQALVGRVKEMSVSDINKLADEILPLIITSMDKQDITDMLKLMLQILPELKFNSGGTCPVEKTYWGDIVDIYGNGMTHSVLRFEAPQQKKLMRAITEGEAAN